MKSIEIKGTVRTDVGKKATHELRKNNGVPCVLYGVQKDENGLPVATHFSVPTEGLRNLVYTPHIYVVALILQVFYNYILSKIEGLTSEMEDSSITLLDMITKYNLKYKK